MDTVQSAAQLIVVLAGLCGAMRDHGTMDNEFEASIGQIPVHLPDRQDAARRTHKRIRFLTLRCKALVDDPTTHFGKVVQVPREPPGQQDGSTVAGAAWLKNASFFAAPQAELFTSS